MTDKRLNFVDMAKGIAIVIIVLYHLVAPGVFASILAHLMPGALVLFFFCSGYFYRPGKRSFQENVTSRAKSLIVPFFKYSLAFWLVGTLYLVITGSAPFVETLYCLRNFLGGCIWNRTIQNWFQWEYYSLGKRYLFLADFWFLIALFFSGLLFFPVADATLQSKSRTLLAVAALLTATGLMRGFDVALPYNLQLVPFWSAIMLLGAFAGRNGLFEIKALSGAAEWGAAIGTLGVGIAVLMLIAPSVNLFRGSFSDNEVVSMLLLTVSSLLMIWGLGELCKLIELSGARVSELTWLGTHTMTFYIFHMFIAWLTSICTGYSLIYGSESSVGLVLQSLLLSCAVFAICAAIAVIKDRMAQHA